MGRRFYVQHCVLNLTTRQYGRHPTSDLLGVDYFVPVPPDTEFPKWVGKLELFVRFFGVDMPPAWVWVTIHRLNPDGSWAERVFGRRVGLPFRSQPGRVIMDISFKLRDISFPRAVEYGVRVRRRATRRWDAAPAWRVLATEYFAVVREP